MWVTNHADLIVKAHISLWAKFWWSTIRWCIQTTFTDNVIILKRSILLANILAGYEIDWARIISEQIHESTVQMNTSLLFPVLIHQLCSAAGVSIDAHWDQHIEATFTMDPSLIKADENTVALPRAAPSTIPDAFLVKPQTHGLTPAPTNITPAAAEPTPSIEIESTPSFSTPAPAISTLQVDSLISIVAFKALVCKVATTESRLQELAAQVRSWVNQTV